MLHILIIPENMQRGDRILDAICKVETESITKYEKAQKRIITMEEHCTRWFVQNPDI